MFGSLLSVIAAFASGGLSLFIQGALITYGIVESRKQIKRAKQARYASSRDRTVTVRSSNAPIFLVYGQTRAGGVLAAPPWTWGPDRRWLTAVIVLAYHEVEEIGDVLFDGESIGPLDANGYVQAGSLYWWTRRASTTHHVAAAPARGGQILLAYTPNKIDSVVYESSDNVTIEVKSGASGYTLSGRTLTLTTDFVQGRPLTITYQFSPATRSTEVIEPWDGDPVTLPNSPIAIAKVSYFRYTQTDPGAPPDALEVTLLQGAEWTISGSVLSFTVTPGASPAQARKLVVHYDHEQGGVALVRVKKFLGIAGGQRDQELEVHSGGQWTANHIGRNVARIHVSMQYDPDFFPGSMPEISAIVKGKKVWDPRTSTVAWTNNPVLCVRDYQASVYGWADDPLTFDDAGHIESANECDEQVEYRPGLFHARYTLDGIVYCDAGLRENRDAMMSTTGGWAGVSNGQFVIRVAKARASVMALDDNDLAGGFETQVDVSYRDLYNSVRGQFINPEKGYQPDDFPPYPNVDTHPYVVADGGRLYADFDFPFTQNVHRAQRLAKLKLYRARQPLSEVVTYNTKAVPLQPLDVVTQTRGMLGYEAKPFLVHDWKLNPAEMTVTLTLQEDAAAVYEHDYNEFTNPNPAPNTVLPNPRYVPPLGDVQVTSDEFTFRLLPDGSREPYIRFTWLPVTSSAVLKGGYIELLWKRGISQEFDRIKIQPIDTVYELIGVRAGDMINWQMHNVNGLEVRSESTIGFHSVSQDLVTSGLPNQGGNLLRNAAFDWPLYAWRVEKNSFGGDLRVVKAPNDRRIEGAFNNLEMYLSGAFGQLPGMLESDRIALNTKDRFVAYAYVFVYNCDAWIRIRSWVKISSTQWQEVWFYDSPTITPSQMLGGSGASIGNYVQVGRLIEAGTEGTTGGYNRISIELHRSATKYGGADSYALWAQPLVARVGNEISDWPQWSNGTEIKPENAVVKRNNDANFSLVTEDGFGKKWDVTTITITGGGELVCEMEAHMLMHMPQAFFADVAFVIDVFPYGAAVGKQVFAIEADQGPNAKQWTTGRLEYSLGEKPAGVYTVRFTILARGTLSAGTIYRPNLQIKSWQAGLKFLEPI